LTQLSNLNETTQRYIPEGYYLLSWTGLYGYCICQGPDDGGSTHLWNVGLVQWYYTVLHPRRLLSSELNWFIWISYTSSPWW
jgi:hypothetical protein